MVDTNQQVIERLYEDVWNGKNPNTAEELVHDAYLIHDRELAEELQGPELYNALASSTRELFSDLTFTIEDVVAADDEIALRWTMVRTHDGPLFGVEPTGERVELTAIEINRFEDGQLIETWTQIDQLDLMEQVGALPATD